MQQDFAKDRTLSTLSTLSKSAFPPFKSEMLH